MGEPAIHLADVTALDPREAASKVASAFQGQPGRLDEFAQHLDCYRAGQSLARTLAAWGLSQSEAAQLFGVSRQAVSKWTDRGVPSERSEAIADLAAATDLLVHYLQRDRIPAVVRRPIAALENRSLIELLAENQTSVILKACRSMFDFDQARQ